MKLKLKTIVATNRILSVFVFRNLFATTTHPKFPITKTEKVVIIQDSAKPKLKNLKIE